jgi:MFS family permease
MSSPSRTPSYSAVLRQPYALRTFGAALIGRFSYGIVFVSLVVALTQATGSYAWAGTALALFGLSTSFLAPLRARLIDRRGPRRVLPTMAAAYATLLAALAAATWGPGTPQWVLLVLTVAAGACAPPLGPVMRALWSYLLPDKELRQRAFSLDTVVEELLFVLGPLVAGLFIAFGNPACGVAVSAVLVLAGTLAMVSSPALRTGATTAAPDEPDTETTTDADADGTKALADTQGTAALALQGRWLRGRGRWLEPFLVAGGVGMCLGAVNLLVVAFAERQGQVASVAWIQAALSVGSAIGGVAYGARTWRLPTRHRLPLLAIALSLILGAAGLAPNLYLLALAVGCAGVFVAPALTTAYLAADEWATPDTRTQAGTWVNSAFNAGSSGGTAAVGFLVGRLPLWLCFVAAAVPTLAYATTSLVRLRLLVRPAVPPTPRKVPADTEVSETH